MPESRPAFLREVINALLTPDRSAADLSLKSDSDVSSAILRNQKPTPAKPRNTRKNPQSQAGHGFGAGNRGRTCTNEHKILNLARLPIPPYPRAAVLF